MSRLFMPGRNALRIGRLFGIDVALDFNWFVVFFILVVSLSRHFEAYLPTHVSSVVFAVALTLALFASVLAHEYGHALTARLFGIRTNKIVLHLFGGVAYLESEARRPRDEFFIAVAGPAVSIVLGSALGVVWYLTREAPVAGMLFGYLAAMNIFLGVFNCVPGFPLDGGRVVRSAIWGLTGDYLKATRIAVWGGVAVGAVFVALGALELLLAVMGSGSIAAGVLRGLLGVFVIYLARLSLRQAEFIAAFRGLTVADLMQPIRAVVPAETLLSDVHARYFQVLRLDSVPVVDGPRLLGAISRQDLDTIPTRQWDWMRAREIVRPYDRDGVLAPGVEALNALEKLANANRYSMPVFEGRRLLGTITQADLARVFRQRRAAM
ncbi:MAG: site-2 protease family protein [Candidatus Sumerlaeia bacterium]|nr:site-2 protease family protein [Candidatus Sumerlaeia bacterium]